MIFGTNEKSIIVTHNQRLKTGFVVQGHTLVSGQVWLPNEEHQGLKKSK